ncbi:MAG: aspartate--tRNA(Asn) ligase [Candidatus Pacebacteria bacterium]|nr:aspartate--tRNA(Asn) ligase [Candidatus Paceibacterota bacterium]
MERTYIKELKNKAGQEVSISGWVDIRRDHGKLIFIDMRDVSGKIQCVTSAKNESAYAATNELRPEWVVTIKGKVSERPEKMVNKDEENGSVELQIEEVAILGRAKELPFELKTEINIDTYLDNLPLTLRMERGRVIFKIQAHIIKAFRNFLTQEGFVEIQAPKIIGEDAEGGANSFAIEYFKHTAHLAQSPQFYKQIMVGVFEKVFATGNVYRAEKHSTTRHLNEYTSLDFEMGFIKDHTDVMAVENKMLRYIVEELEKNCEKEIAHLEANLPSVPKNIPSVKLREAQEILKKEYEIDCENAPDLEPEHERKLCEYSKEKLDSEFIFVTHFPMSKRPMYTYEDEEDIGYAKGFDLLFRGLEITTGSQRVHDYDILVEAIKKKGLDPEKFAFYLQAFKYGMPPHGGIGLGLERLTAKLLGLENVKEATLFPRDLNRIDTLLSTDKLEQK